MKVSKTEENEARQALLDMIKPGQTVYTILRSVSRSGMSRGIDCYIMQDGEPRWITSLVAKVTGFTFDRKRECLKVGGCGMDMGFHVVYTLSRCLYRDTFECVGEHCPSNDHSNGDRNYKPHKHSDGGYALKHRWM